MSSASDCALFIYRGLRTGELWKVRESRRWLYFPKMPATAEGRSKKPSQSYGIKIRIQRPLAHISPAANRYTAVRPKM